MKEFGIVIVILMAGGLVALLYHRVKQRQRREVRATPLSEADRALLQKEVPLYAALPSEFTKEMGARIQVFLYQVGFEPCGQLEEVTREMQ